MCIKKQRHHFTDKDLYSQSHGFSSSHVWMWELDHKEGWAPKNWCFWTVLLEKTLESPLDSKEVKPVHPKGNQPWIFIGRTVAEAEAPILWPPDMKSQLMGKTLMLGKIEGRRRRERQKRRWLDVVTNSTDMNLSKLREIGEDRGAWHAIVHGAAKSHTGLSNWTTATMFLRVSEIKAGEKTHLRSVYRPIHVRVHVLFLLPCFNSILPMY